MGHVWLFSDEEEKGIRGFEKSIFSSLKLKIVNANQLLKQNKSEYIFENICYKETSKIPIIEESAKLKIAKNLVKLGKKVLIRDEIQLINEVKKEYGNLFRYEVL